MNPASDDGVKAMGAGETTRDHAQLAQMFRALGHPTRLGIVAKIISGEFCVIDLQEHLDRSQANLSQHLAVLRDRGLAIPERRGNKGCYRLADERITQLVTLAADVAGTVRRAALSNED